MVTIEDIQLTIKPELDMLNRRISAALSSSNSLMDSVVKGYLKSKGKMIRPVLVILTAKLFGGSNDDNIISAAAAVEMLHNASLIHDDVIDESKLRRGFDTINSTWGNHIAVLTGDFFVSSALQQAIATGDIRIVDSLAHLGKLLSLGEIDQIYNARYHCLDEKAYFQIISRKTASLFVSCIKMGAYAAGVATDDPRLKEMCRFAELLGLCFQIKDDIFDYFEDPRIGKPTGNDIREGKITLPLLYALQMSGHKEAKAMTELSRKEQLTTEEITTLIDFAKRAGGIDYAYETMKHLSFKAHEILDAFPPSDTLTSLRNIFDYIIVRKH